MVARASKIHVALSDKREFDARVIGADTKSDLAIIKIDSKKINNGKIGAITLKLADIYYKTFLVRFFVH